MSRRNYLISYDISDDKRRTKVFHLLRDQGDHAQFSVFFCELTKMELLRLRAKIGEAIHQRQDQVMILDLGESDGSFEVGLECLGRAFEPTRKVLVV